MTMRVFRIQLQGRDGNAVQKEQQVNADFVVQRVTHLPHDAQSIGGVTLHDIGVHRQRRLRLRHA